MSTKTVSVAEARANFSKIGEAVNATGEPVTVFRRSKPWLIITPAAPSEPNAETRGAMAETDRRLSDPNRIHYSSFEDLMSALESEQDRA